MNELVYKPAAFMTAFAIMFPAQKQLCITKVYEIPITIRAILQVKTKQLLLSSTNKTKT